MTVRFKCQSEYQRSYRSRSVSPQRCAPLAGLRSDYMGISREPCLHRRKKFINHDPLHSCGSTHQTPAEPVPDAATTKPPAAPKKQQIQPVESEPPPAPRPAGDLSGKPLDIEKSASRPTSVKLRSSKTENRPHSDSHSPAAPNPQQHFSNNHALCRKVGLKSAGPRTGLHKTEYNRQFYFKKTPGAPSPILSAHQALYSSHRSVPPFKNNPVSMETEYQHSFQVQVLPTGPRLRKNLEHERMPLFHTHVNNKKKDLTKNTPVSKSESLEKDGKKTVSPIKELPPDPAPSTAPVQRRHRILTEYEARYGSPLNKIPEEGEAMVSHTPQVKELREQAQSHRRRAWGTNFSRDHLSQLLSEHNALWEPSETLDSATDPHPTHLDLCQVSSAGPDSCSISCVEALDLASHSSRSSRRTSAVGSKDGEDNQSPLGECNLASAKENELSYAEEEGRLPTPKLKMLPVQRTHHDLTTPAAGGAILVGKLKTSDEPSAHNQATFAIERAGTAESVLANAETVEQIPVKPKDAWSEDSIHHNRPASSPVRKPITHKQTSPVTTVPPPTVPLHCIQGTLRHADFQHNGELGLRFKERLCTGGCCGSDEDDRLTVMSWRSAASCSMASAVLERAKKRRENVWGKR